MNRPVYGNFIGPLLWGANQAIALKRASGLQMHTEAEMNLRGLDDCIWEQLAQCPKGEKGAGLFAGRQGFVGVQKRAFSGFEVLSSLIKVHPSVRRIGTRGQGSNFLPPGKEAKADKDGYAFHENGAVTWVAEKDFQGWVFGATGDFALSETDFETWAVTDVIEPVVQKSPDLNQCSQDGYLLKHGRPPAVGMEQLNDTAGAARLVFVGQAAGISSPPSSGEVGLGLGGWQGPAPHIFREG